MGTPNEDYTIWIYRTNPVLAHTVQICMVSKNQHRDAQYPPVKSKISEKGGVIDRISPDTSPAPGRWVPGFDVLCHAK